MKRFFIFLSAAIIAAFSALKVNAQGTAINSTGAAAHNSAMLDVSSTTQGVLVPRMDSTQRATISSPATGLLVYQTNGIIPGFYFYNGSAWTSLNSSITSLTGDVTASGNGSVPATIGTNVISNAKAAQMPANTIKGNNTGSTANPSDLTIAQVQSMLGFSSNTFAKAKVTYQVSAGVGAGAAVANVWTTRPLNTIRYDDIGISLASNQITLPAGTYEVSAYCVFNNHNFGVGDEKIRIWNITAGTTLGISLNSSMSVAANYSSYPAMINNERFTLAATSTIALQYYIPTPEFGVPYSAPTQAEVYAEVIFTKL